PCRLLAQHVCPRTPGSRHAAGNLGRMTMQPVPVIAGEALVKTFRLRHRTVQAVQGVSLAVRAGEALGIVGESGCGKTTTARLLLRLEEPTSGQVLLDGRDVHTLEGDGFRDYRAKVQAVFQDPWSSLNPRMRV